MTGEIFIIFVRKSAEYFLTKTPKELKEIFGDYPDKEALVWIRDNPDYDYYGIRDEMIRLINLMEEKGNV